MSALDCIKRVNQTSISKDNTIRYCLVNAGKLPFRIDGSLAQTNNSKSFVCFDDLRKASNLLKYRTIGISIQFSNLCGIDIDHCFTTPLDFKTADERAKDIYTMFKDFSYIEFSFSGKGMRVLFKTESIDNYKSKYFIKNSKNNIEYYQTSYGTDAVSYRYLTLTGNTIIDNYSSSNLKQADRDTLFAFLNKYMLRDNKSVVEPFKSDLKEVKTSDEIKKRLRWCLLKDNDFQDNWFNKATGSHTNESERDYYLCVYIYKNITTNQDMIINIFEQSPFYKSKDEKHITKWNKNNKQYFRRFIYPHLKEL